MKKKYYAVKKGHKTGIFNTWDECKKQVDGYSGAIYKSFNDINEAKDFLNIKTQVENTKYDVIAYVDGSYDNNTKQYSYGMVIIVNGEKEFFNKKFSNHKLCEMRNVAGEIMGSRKAMEYCIEKGYKSILIHYDYLGIEKWCTGEWKTNKEGTKEYKKYYDSIKDIISISFKKVKAHSGDTYNELADSLAKSALGI